MSLPAITLTPEQKAMAIGLAAIGKGLPEIIKALDLDSNTFSALRNRDPDFAEKFSAARAEGMEHLADSLLTVVDDKPDVQKARVHSENVRWLLSKRQPQIYGERIDLNVNQTVDISGALLEARRRALPVTDQALLDPPQQLDAVDVSPATATDTQSVATAEQPPTKIGDDDIFS